MFGTLKTESDGTEAFTPAGQMIWLDKITINIEDETEELTLRSKNKTLTVPRKDLLENHTDLVAHGFDVFKHNISTFNKHIQNQEPNAEKVFTHKGLGWSSFRKEKVFKSYKLLHSITDDTSLPPEFNSIYCGTKKLKTKGKYAKWKTLVEEDVLGTNLELALVLGLSSAVVGYLGDEFSSESIVSVITGSTSTGKSTFGLLALSCGSSAESIAKADFSINFNSTLNYIMKSIEGNYGYTVLLDDTSASTLKTFDELIYTLNTGMQRGRLNQLPSETLDTGFKTSFIITAEMPLQFKKSKKGTAVRFLQFNDVQWTTSAEHSEHIKKVISKNSGQALIKLCKYLLTLDYNTVVFELENCRQEFLKYAKSDNRLLHRLSIKVGILILTAKLVNEALGLELNITNLMNLIIDNNSLEGVDEVQEAYQYILEFCVKHERSFAIGKMAYEREVYFDSKGSTTNGLIDYIKGELVFPKGVLENILSYGGFENTKSILSGFKANDLMCTYGDRLTKKRKLVPKSNQIATDVYVIKFEGDDSVPDILDDFNNVGDYDSDYTLPDFLKQQVYTDRRFKQAEVEEARQAVKNNTLRKRSVKTSTSETVESTENSTTTKNRRKRPRRD